MKRLITISLLAFVIAATSVAHAEEWVSPGDKPGALITAKPKLTFKVSAKGEQFTVNLSDGKQKFGSFVFQIKNGENVYLRPRLLINIPLTEAKAVKSGSPLKLASFTHTGDAYELSLVDNSDSDLPNTVLTKK